jgi:hypothetical protein
MLRNGIYLIAIAAVTALSASAAEATRTCAEHFKLCVSIRTVTEGPYDRAVSAWTFSTISCEQRIMTAKRTGVWVNQNGEQKKCTR